MQVLDAGSPHGHFDPGLEPRLTVGPGETVRLSTLESGWSPERFDPGRAERARHPLWTPESGHALTGPVGVRGARAGGTLAVRVDAVVPGTWGTTYAGRHDNAYTRAYGLDGQSAVHARSGARKGCERKCGGRSSRRVVRRRAVAVPTG